MITVNNVVYAFRLQSTEFDKKSYLTHLKGTSYGPDGRHYLSYSKNPVGYMKAVKAKLQETNPDRVAAFESGAQAFAKKIVTNFKDYEFLISESMAVEGMVLLLNYREDGITPYLTFWRDGVREEKV